MKISAQVCLYDDTEFLVPVIESVYQNLDVIYFLINKKPWNGKPRPDDRAKCLAVLQELVKKYPKCQIVEGEWAREYEQRNHGLDLANQAGHGFQVILDSDEVYHPFEFENFTNIMKQNPKVAAFHSSWNTYWKQEPMYQVEPRESFNPLIAANVNQFRFCDKRQGLTMDEYGIPHSSYQFAYLPPHVVLVHHFSYARSDEYIKNKLQNFEHFDEILPGWYDNIWLGFKPGDRNIHPTTASQYATAVEVNLNMLPKNIKAFLENKKK